MGTTKTKTRRTPAPAHEPDLSSPEQDSERDTQHEVQQWNWLEDSPGKLVAAGLFGLVFGFLLQKGGVAKFDILLGVLLLENFVVVKVMLSAIIVGMIGSYFLRKAGLIELQIKKTRYGADIVGGLIFGVGFGLLAYCPGTNAAAVGQGNLDALVGVIGLLAGSYVYALSSKHMKKTVSGLGERGKLTLPEVVGLSPGVFIALAAPALIIILGLLELFGF